MQTLQTGLIFQYFVVAGLINTAVAAVPADVLEGRDVVLQRALEVLSAQ